MRLLRPQQLYIPILLLLHLLLHGHHVALAGPGKVITLGDSYSSGPGIHTGFRAYDEFFGVTATLDGRTYKFSRSISSRLPQLAFCLREKQTTPGAKLANKLGVEFEMEACSAARSTDIYDQIDYLNARFPQEAARHWKDSIIILTVGLNDLVSADELMWIEVVVECVRPRNDCSTNPKNLPKNPGAVKQELTNALSYLADIASEATIRVFGYGQLFQRNNTREGDCSGAFGISNQEADFIDQQWYKFYNNITQQVVEEILLERTESIMIPTTTLLASKSYNNNVGGGGVHQQEEQQQHQQAVSSGVVDMEYIDVTDYLTIGACSTERDGGRHMNGALEGLPFGLFHPSRLGYDQYYHALLDNLNLDY